MENQNHLNGQYEALKGSVKNLSNSAKNQVESQMDSITKLGMESLHEAKVVAVQAAHDLSSQLTSAGKRAEAFVRRNPMTSVGIVLVLGYAATRMIQSRSPRSGQNGQHRA
jgi:ElaB/YqjD/DUF883 family membrane-anchored ribosome-binding protein